MDIFYNVVLRENVFKTEFFFCFECVKIGVSLDETVEEDDLNDLLSVFGCSSSAVST